MAGYVNLSDCSRSAFAALLFCFFVGIGELSAEVLRVVSYNVENLFYPERDSVNTDSVFTPEGERRWSWSRYSQKVENIARVLTVIGEWDGVDVAGLQEVESKECVERLCQVLRRGEYDFVHYDSPDRRGIDVALIYKKARLDTLCTKALHVDLGEQTTRDILYVRMKVKGRRTKEENERTKEDTIHFFVCHMPSQLGGASETAWKRDQAKRVLQRAVDSVLAADINAKIVVMGDMNNAQFTMHNSQFTIHNLQCKMDKGKGTHKYQGRWTCLDQFYTSQALDSISEVRVFDAEWIQEPDEKYLGLRPKRTFVGFHYQNGFSDHLPIVLVIQ